MGRCDGCTCSARKRAMLHRSFVLRRWRGISISARGVRWPSLRWPSGRVPPLCRDHTCKESLELYIGLERSFKPKSASRKWQLFNTTTAHFKRLIPVMSEQSDPIVEDSTSSPTETPTRRGRPRRGAPPRRQRALTGRSHRDATESLRAIVNQLTPTQRTEAIQNWLKDYMETWHRVGDTVHHFWERCNEGCTRSVSTAYTASPYLRPTDIEPASRMCMADLTFALLDQAGRCEVPISQYIRDLSKGRGSQRSKLSKGMENVLYGAVPDPDHPFTPCESCQESKSRCVPCFTAMSICLSCMNHKVKMPCIEWFKRAALTSGGTDTPSESKQASPSDNGTTSLQPDASGPPSSLGFTSTTSLTMETPSV